MHFPRKGTRFFFFFYFSDFKSVKKMYPYEENAFFLLILNVFLVRVHFFTFLLQFFRFQKSKKNVPYEENAFFFTNFDCFPRKDIFFLFFRFQKCKKNVPLRGKCIFFLLILTVFLVRVHFFYSFLLFFRFQKCKQSVPLQGKCSCFTNFDCFPRKGTPSLLFFTFFRFQE